MKCIYCDKPILETQWAINFKPPPPYEVYFMHETPCFGQATNFAALSEKARKQQQAGVQATMFG